MALTKDFKDTIQVHAQRDPAFRKALLQEGVEELSLVFDKSKCLMRMFGSKGNPMRVSCLR